MEELSGKGMQRVADYGSDGDWGVGLERGDERKHTFPIANIALSKNITTPPVKNTPPCSMLGRCFARPRGGAGACRTYRLCRRLLRPLLGVVS